MAELLLSVERTFGAGHTVPNDPDCAFPGHGHTWRVAVTLQGALDPRSNTGKLTELDGALAQLVSEVEGRSFNDMAPQIVPNLEGIAMWILDRLLSTSTKIVEVKLECPDQRRSCSIRRQPR